MTYEALVCRVSTRPHPNADRLQLATANGYQVIVGLDVVNGELGVFFGPDGQLSEEMAEANDLVQRTDPDTGERKGGYFAKNRRVRSQKLRGEKSDGFWTGLDSFDWTEINPLLLKEGDTFTELNGHFICNKYITPATLRAMRGGTPKTKRENICFPKHVETAPLKHYIDQIPTDSIIYITEKVHGTSGRFGFVTEEREVPNNFLQRLFRRKPKLKTDYAYLLGTRNIILADHTVEGYYGNEEFRWKAMEPLFGNTFRGEVFYFELVGYTTTNATIMSPQITTEFKKDLKGYASPMVYKYGQVEGTCGLYVYRITRTNENGNIVELSWPQVKQRCNQLGINHVPELPGFPIIHFGDSGGLMKVVESMLEGPSTLDTSHIREGVVVRVEQPNGETEFYKAKSFTFGVLEGYLKDSEDYVDLEEAS